MKHPLTSKLLKEKIERYNWAPSNFAEYLECTEEEFWEALRKTYTGGTFDSFEKGLKSNQKKQERAKKQSFKRLTNTYSQLENDLSGETRSKYEAPANTETLESLQEQYSSWRDELTTIYKDTESLSAAKTEIELDLSQKQVKLNELTKQVNSLKSEINRNQDQIKNITKKIASNIVSESECKKELSEISKKIELFKKVTIFVYGNGEFEISSKSPVEFPNDWSDIFNELISKNELEELTIKQLKALAQVFSLKRVLTKESRALEITFENPISEEYFKKAS